METILGHENKDEDLNSLTEEFAVWLASNGLPDETPDKLLAGDKTPLNEAQRLFLTEFCLRWETAAMGMAVNP
ncbi:MAG TPA: hypothetical protein VK308_15575 [Pyrinomonadaceae bacterium]|nr:hypothetical protein [Pyrinomonadaceae bacterium]